MIRFTRKYSVFNQVAGDNAGGGGGTQTTTTTPTTASTQVPSDTPSVPDANTAPVNPMEQFNKMVADAKAKSTPAPDTQTPPADSWAISQDSMRTSSKAISDALMSSLDQTQVTSALQGDAQAFNSVISNAVQLAYIASVQQATAIAKNAVAQQLAQFDSGLEGKFANWQTSDKVMADPRMADPAIATMVNSMLPTIKQANPGATPAAITSIVSSMLDAMGAKLGTPATTQQPSTSVPAQDAIDWSAVFKTQ